MRNHSLRGHVRWALTLSGMFVASAWLLSVSGCHKEEAQAQEAPKPLVTEATAVARTVPLYLDEIGRAASIENVTIRPQVAGEIIAVKFNNGDEVKQGQLLYEIDPTPYEAALAQAKAALAEAKASLELDQINYKRAQQLIGSNAISQQEYDQDRLTVEVDKAKVAAAEANVKAAEVNLQYCYIKSPIDGRAGATQVTLGNVVKANDTALLSIQSVDPIYADFTIPENKLPEVREHMSEGTLRVLVELPEEVAQSGDNAFQNARQGELTFLDNSVQDATGTVKLRATVPNKDHHFWPGQFVRVRLVLKELKDAVMIPSEATQISQTGPYVYVIKGDNTADMRPIQPGQVHAGMIVVEKGLKAGEKVVLSGQMTVIPGGQVRVQNDSTTQPAAESASSGKEAAISSREAEAS